MTASISSPCFLGSIKLARFIPVDHPDSCVPRSPATRLSSMAFREVLQPLITLDGLQSHLRNFSESLGNADCSSFGAGGEAVDCRDDEAAFRLKMVAIAVILISSVGGVALPLVGTNRRLLRVDSGAFVVAKAFAAGVILATGFVHVLADSQEALTSDCLPSFPWSQFPFPGFFAMLSALGTLVVDFVGTQLYEKKAAARDEESTVGLLPGSTYDKAAAAVEEGGGLLVVVPHAHGGHSHGSAASHLRHVVVSQILELGIVSHSVIIGLSLGVTMSPCTIRPLIAALSFHQFFEGFALGGCISQAQFRPATAAMMAFFFAVTTSAGIAAGAAVSSFYNPNSPKALVVEGVLDAFSAGILIYMALVDLIAADFLSRSRNFSEGRLHAFSFVALFLGALTMSLLALWA